MDMGTLKNLDTVRTPVVTGLLEGSQRQPTRAQAPDALASQAAAVATQTPAPVEQPQVLDREQLEQTVSDMQDFVQSVQRNINFQLDDDSGRVVINVIERDSGDVIRQIPSEEALRLAENLAEIRSLLFSAEA